jgi:hypothetical protein
MSFEDPFNSNNVPTNDDTSNNSYSYNDEDPAAEFLEREKRELGDITGNDSVNSFEDQFNTTNNSLTNGRSILIISFLSMHCFVSFF